MATKVKKNKKEKNQKIETLVSIVLDRSGSMKSCATNTISALNEYKNGLSNIVDKKTNLHLSLAQFDSSYEIVYIDKPLEQSPDLTTETFVPRGCTALYDAIGKNIHDIENKIKGRENKVAIMMIIVTDGEENSSQEFDQKRIFDIVEKKKIEGWTFVYLGANQDSFKAGSSIGVQHGNSINYSTSNMPQMMSSMVRGTVNFSATVGIQGVSGMLGISGCSGISGCAGGVSNIFDSDLPEKLFGKNILSKEKQ